MAIKEPLASSADSQMTGITLQTAGQEQDNNNSGGFADKDSVTEQPDEEAAAPAGYKSDAPDGGVQAWLVVLGAWCTSFCSFGWLNSESIASVSMGGLGHLTRLQASASSRSTTPRTR